MVHGFRKRTCFALVVAAVVCGSLDRGGRAEAKAPSLHDCSAAEHHELDFWLGDWDVYGVSDGVRYASSRIESSALGCAIRETYDSPSAPGGHYVGTSYSTFDRRAHIWRQFYVDSRGQVTVYAGARQGAALVFTAPAARGIQRMTYRPDRDGSVRQIGEVSVDGGRTWSLTYEYVYRRPSRPMR